MDKFVKGENEMWKMPAKESIQTRIVSASAVKIVQAKKKPINYYASIILITEMWQNISGENLKLLNSKILSIFGST